LKASSKKVTVGDNGLHGIDVQNGSVARVSGANAFIADADSVINVNNNLAGSTLNRSANGDGVLIQQNSVMTVFNTPQFSGAPGFSTVSALVNTRSGVRVLNCGTYACDGNVLVRGTRGIVCPH
jgi:hypothetical protein